MDDLPRHTMQMMFGPPSTTSPMERRLVAFLDVLGWSATSSKIESLEQLQAVFRAIKLLELGPKIEKLRKKQFKGIGDDSGQTIRTAFFSDSLIYSCAAEPTEAPWLIFSLRMVCLELLRQGFYFRGAITVGELLHEERTIFGEALVRAVELEKSVAIYPRLIVSDEAAHLLTAPALKGMTPGPPQVRADRDHINYLDIFGTWKAGTRTARTHKEALEARAKVESDLANVRDLSLLRGSEKAAALRRRSLYGWMLSYLDDVIADPADPPTEGATDD